mgnify:CR=1 FL=1
MDLKTFKAKLDAYGADFSRWEGAPEKEVSAFMAASAEARELHAQAVKLDKALDAFAVESPHHAIMGGVNSRIGGAQGGAGGNNIAPFPLRIEMPTWKIAAGMGMAAAAVVVLFVFSTLGGGTTDLVRASGGDGAVIAARDDGHAQVEAFVTEVASLRDEEDIEAGEIFALLETAQAPAGSADDVDAFLDDLYEADEAHMIDQANPVTATDAPPEQDIWEMFYSVTDAP